jgi:hypothetical protein
MFANRKMIVKYFFTLPQCRLLIGKFPLSLACSLSIRSDENDDGKHSDSAEGNVKKVFFASSRRARGIQFHPLRASSLFVAET